MKLPSIREIARAYLMSIIFWWGFALLMGLQYRPLDRQHLLRPSSACCPT